MKIGEAKFNETQSLIDDVVQKVWRAYFMRHGWGAVEKDSISISWKEERKKERKNELASSEE